MNVWRIIVTAGLVGWIPLSAFPQSAEPSGQVLQIDKLIDWKNPLGLSQQQLDNAFPPGTDGKAGFRPVQSKNSYGGVTVLLSRKAGDGLGEVTWSSRDLPVKSMVVDFGESKECRQVSILLRSGGKGESIWPAVVAELTSQLGKVPQSGGRVKMSGDRSVPSETWSVPGSFSVISFEPDEKTTVISVSRASESTNPKSTSANLAADLTPLTDFSAIWKWTPEEFEKHYIPKAKDAKNPQFEWENAAKDRARFSRKMFGDVETKLTLFGGVAKVEEAIVEFVNGRVGRVTVSFYNRGDSGNISVTDFDRLYKKVGQNLTEILKVSPRSQLNSSNAALKTTGWNWTTPAGIALLEYNDYTARNASGATSAPEFLRLKLAAPNQADWSMGKLSVGVQRMALTKNVTKTQEGDVYIAGVPMVDQGAKGYCVAASCQRLFEYMRIPCDQHEMAKLLSVDAGGGADIMVMQKSLAKVDSQFQVSFKPLVNPLNYYDSRHNRRVSLKEYSSIIKEYVDKGVPLLWGLLLGQYPEEPPLPRTGQIMGGHMRLIIGYNPVKNQILFTDSWGAGHELKRTKATDAYSETLGLYSMAPRGM